MINNQTCRKCSKVLLANEGICSKCGAYNFSELAAAETSMMSPSELEEYKREMFAVFEHLERHWNQLFIRAETPLKNNEKQKVQTFLEQVEKNIASYEESYSIAEKHMTKYFENQNLFNNPEWFFGAKIYFTVLAVAASTMLSEKDGDGFKDLEVPNGLGVIVLKVWNLFKTNRSYVQGMTNALNRSSDISEELVLESQRNIQEKLQELIEVINGLKAEFI